MIFRSSVVVFLSSNRLKIHSKIVSKMKSSICWFQDALSRPKRLARRLKNSRRRPQDGSMTPPRRTKTSPKRFQDASRTPRKRLQERSKTVLPPTTPPDAAKKLSRRPKMLPRRSQDAPKRSQDASRLREDVLKTLQDIRIS